MIRSIPNLLRRTLVFLVAVPGFATVSTALAQGTVTLSSGGTCTYSAMTIQPNGNVSVTCTSGPNNPDPPKPPPGQAYFAISGPTSLAPSTPYNTGQFKVSRTDTNGPAENVAFGYVVTGTGCVFRSEGPFWLTPPNGAKPSENLNIVTGQSGGCTITLTIQEGHAGSAPATMTVQGGGVTPPAGCPAPPVDAVAGDLPFGPIKEIRAGSGQITYYPVHSPPDLTRTVVSDFTQGQTSILPSGNVVTEFSVSRCPGVIDTAIPQCYYRNTFVLTNKISIYTAPVPVAGFVDQASIGERGCFAPSQVNGVAQNYYVNVRWTYPTCSFGPGNCGFSMQWAQGSNY